MSAERTSPTERFIGFSTLECAREIVRFNPEIAAVQLRAYCYIPNKPSENDEPIFRLNREEFLIGFCLITSIVTVTPDDVPNQHEVISDYRYIGHSLIRGSTGLRITTRGTKTFEPRVVAVI